MPWKSSIFGLERYVEADQRFFFVLYVDKKESNLIRQSTIGNIYCSKFHTRSHLHTYTHALSSGLKLWQDFVLLVW